MIVFTVNEQENICIAGLNRRAGYAAALPFLFKICTVNIITWNVFKVKWYKSDHNPVFLMLSRFDFLKLFTQLKREPICLLVKLKETNIILVSICIRC